MDWQPISELELRDRIICAEARMTPEQQRLWEAIKIDPKKWQQEPYGIQGGGFWVVALVGGYVVWFNDIEDGFNISIYKQHGIIDEYQCHQDELEKPIQSLLNLIRHGYSLPKCSPPIG